MLCSDGSYMFTKHKKHNFEFFWCCYGCSEKIFLPIFNIGKWKKNGKIVPENPEKLPGHKMSHHNFKSNPMGYPENLVALPDIDPNIICVYRLFGMGVGPIHIFRIGPPVCRIGLRFAVGQNHFPHARWLGASLKCCFGKIMKNLKISSSWKLMKTSKKYFQINLNSTKCAYLRII